MMNAGKRRNSPCAKLKILVARNARTMPSAMRANVPPSSNPPITEVTNLTTGAPPPYTLCNCCYVPQEVLGELSFLYLNVEYRGRLRIQEAERFGAEHLIRRPYRNDTTALESDNSIRNTPDDVHVMFHYQDCYRRRSMQLLKYSTHHRLLFRVESRGWFV